MPKIIKSEMLDPVFYVDREKKDPLKMRLTDEQERLQKTLQIPITPNDATTRDYLKICIDMPSPRDALTLDKARSLEKCYLRLDEGGDFVVENCDFENLKEHVISKIGINKQVVLIKLSNLFDSATDYVAPKKQVEEVKA